MSEATATATGHGAAIATATATDTCSATQIGATAAAALLPVLVNGQPHTLPAGSTLADLVGALSLAPESIATAVNGGFVARDRRALRPLLPDDSVTFFQAIVGG